MPEWLFSSFTDSAGCPPEATQFWQQMWQRVMPEGEVARGWRVPWMHNPDADGNPIFTAVSQEQRRGVRIIQEESPSAEENDLDWWLDNFGEVDDPEGIRELVIACCPSQQNTALIERLLRQWIYEGTVPQTPEEHESARTGVAN